MKFKKRFLMCLAIVGVLLAPSVAKAGDANALNKWMTEVPDSDQMINTDVAGITARFAPVRGAGQSIKRNQKFYRNGRFKISKKCCKRYKMKC